MGRKVGGGICKGRTGRRRGGLRLGYKVNKQIIEKKVGGRKEPNYGLKRLKITNECLKHGSVS